MVDLKEPARREYSTEESIEVSQSFLLLLFYFLAFYLLLHNLLIPLVLNVFRGQDLLLDVHYWFLFSFPLVLWVKNKKAVPRSFIFFLCLGSFARLILYSTLLYVKSWTIVSVYLSEFSLLIYCVLVYQKSYNDKFLILSFAGLCIPYGLTYVESHSLARKVVFPEISQEMNLTNEGCEGSHVTLTFPAKGIVSDSVVIRECGFAGNTAFINRSFKIQNQQKHLIHLRLFKLSHKEGKLYWKFVRMLKIDPRHEVSLDQYLKKDSLFLLKAPERRNLGILLLVLPDVSLEGKMTFTPDMIKKDIL